MVRLHRPTSSAASPKAVSTARVTWTLRILFQRHHLPTARERFDKRLTLSMALAAATKRSVDVVSLNDAPPLFARRIVLDGRRLLRVDSEADHAFVRDVQLRAADLEPFLRRTRGIKLKWLKER